MANHHWLKTINIGAETAVICSLQDFAEHQQLQRLPMCSRILLENILRQQITFDIDRSEQIQVLLQAAGRGDSHDINFQPARVLMQDFTGVPAVTDLAAMRDLLNEWNVPADEVNPLLPVDLVIDHSVQVDQFGNDHAIGANIRLEMLRNKERYAFLKWGAKAFQNFSVVPPGMGICHQVNLEYLATVACHRKKEIVQLYPDTLVGTDSHTTMVNGLGVLGWGVGGIEAEAAMLGQSISFCLPAVVGVHMTGALAAGVTSTDLVLCITEKLRSLNVVEKMVEFFGPGLASLTVSDRATISNMSPEYGATVGLFPIDDKTLSYLRLTGRSDKNIQLVHGYYQQQQMMADHLNPDKVVYDYVVDFDLSQVEASIAGPKRPQDRILLRHADKAIEKHLQRPNTPGRLSDGSVVIAAITSCTNTSNPSVMLAAGLLARKAVAKGLKVPAWVKTSLAPGSRVVTEYLANSGLLQELKILGFHVVGYGCTTCIGNSGPLAPEVSEAIHQDDLTTVAVLSGNRNFEGRIHPDVRLSYLASPPLVIAYALAGRMTIDWDVDPIGHGPQGEAVYLRDLWPSEDEINELLFASVQPILFRQQYQHVFEGTKDWERIKIDSSPCFSWQDNSTYLRRPQFLTNLSEQASSPPAFKQARCLLILGDSVTTDHISPAGAITINSPAAEYLQSHNIEPENFNSYGSRRGNYEVMMRGTFANSRLRNLMCPDREGGWTYHFPSKKLLNVFAASELYQQQKVPLLVIAGKEYGSGSSRDWAAKGPLLLGVRAVLAQSFERIHRSNLIGMGILPLEFMPGTDAQSLGLTGEEVFDLSGWDNSKETLNYTNSKGQSKSIPVKVRINTASERSYFLNGGILPFVARKIAHNWFQKHPKK